MTFTSTAFLLFLPLTFALYWLFHLPLLRRHPQRPNAPTPQTLTWQNGLLVVASYLFYGWWDWRFLGLIALTSFCSYASGIAIERAKGNGRRRWAAANILLNLGILGLFKYLNFFADSLCRLLALVGLHPDVPTLHLILPVGISFYTFQALSYTIDVYRRRLPATHHLMAFLAYISFFPQLVAGPIERATQLLPQMLRARTFNYSEAVDGLRQMLWGFAKKVVVADTCATAVNQIWADPSAQSSLALALGAVLFSIQIYGDFSGYSDIAVGCARLFGIRLMQNFNQPYFASDLAAFWRRWHISLMAWLRDYVYIPLGGNRCSAPRAAANVLLVFLVSGLWHGAAWTYVLWGLYHGLLLIALRRRHTGIAVTFTLVTLGWILFRAPTLTHCATYIHMLFTQGRLFAFSTFMGKHALMWSVLMLAVEWLQRNKPHPLCLPTHGVWRHRTARWALYYLLIALILCCPGQSQAFIYFQF